MKSEKGTGSRWKETEIALNRLRSSLRVASLVALLVAAALPTAADDVGITSARLLELTDGGYALEADMPPMLVGALRPPVVPERFTTARRPTYRRVGVSLVVRYEFSGSDLPLEAGDVLLLPWARSAVLLTARWRDGEVHRAMFPRSAAGIRVPIETLRPVERSAVSVARRYVSAGLDGAALMLLRFLLVLGIVTAAGGLRAVRLAIVFACGHALALVALDLGVSTIPQALAGAGLALGAALVARAAFSTDRVRLWPLILALGLVDGLGIAGGLGQSGLGPGEMVPALFGVAAGIDILLVMVVVALTGIWQKLRRPKLGSKVATAVGSIAVAFAIASITSDLGTAGGSSIDQADQMAALRFDFRSGVGAGGTAGAGRVAPPRGLEDAAMAFLTVEPMEVRIEVLLSLLDFIEPLRIEGDRRSVVPVQVQGAIAARAGKMVADTLEVVIDGRRAVPLLARTDFVTVAATGVAIREQPQPELLDTAVLGVTMAYGVDRPPSEVSVRWQVFPTPATVVPAVWTDPTGSERVELTPEQPVLQWANDLSSFEPPPVRAVIVDPPQWPVASSVLVVLATALWILSNKLTRPRWKIVAAWVALAGAVVLYPFARRPVTLMGVSGTAPARIEAAEVLDDLLTNVYRSLDLRDEEAIYDWMAVSVIGEQLTEVYLENRRALELENRGGARARVEEVEVLEVSSVRRDGEGGFRVEATWNVSGSVNHFGHLHYRQNRYDAAIHLLAVDGAWKIRKIELLDERRVL